MVLFKQIQDADSLRVGGAFRGGSEFGRGEVMFFAGGDWVGALGFERCIAGVSVCLSRGVRDEPGTDGMEAGLTRVNGAASIVCVANADGVIAFFGSNGATNEAHRRRSRNIGLGNACCPCRLE